MKQIKKPELFDVINTLLAILIVLIIIYPVWYVFICSFSDSGAVIQGKVFLLPKEITFEAYKLTLGMNHLFTAYGNSFFYTVVGTTVSLVLTMLAAYPLSRKRLAGRGWLTLFIMITMWFCAGMIPTYLNFRDLGLINNRLGIILGHAVSAYYIVLMRSQFESLPDALEESAKIDGANDFSIFLRIYVPLSIPTLMTLGMYYAVARWNSYFWEMLLLKSIKKVPLQVLIAKLVMEFNRNMDTAEAVEEIAFNKETLMYSTIVVSTIPMLMLYPFIQKYFVRGITLGAVKT